MKQIFFVLLLSLGTSAIGFGGPRPYSADRYSVIWHESFVFEKSSRIPSDVSTDEEWIVAGVFSFGGEEGAIVVNTNNGSIEHLRTSIPSPSGLILTQVLPSETGQAPRIEVTRKGKLLTLSGTDSEKPFSENIALKYVPSTILPAPSSIAYSDNR